MAHTESLFPGQPDDAALWVFSADRPLHAEQQHMLTDMLNRFLGGWTSHERTVVADAACVDDRFLIVCAHIPDGDVSGCGIDKLAHAAQEAADRLGFNWLNALDILYRGDSGDIVATTRAAFRRLVAEGVVDATTTVFDTSPSKLFMLKQNGLERRAAESWHGRVFHIGAAVGA